MSDDFVSFKEGEYNCRIYNVLHDQKANDVYVCKYFVHQIARVFHAN